MNKMFSIDEVEQYQNKNNRAMSSEWGLRDPEFVSFPQTFTPVQYNQCLSTINYYMRNCIELKCKNSVIFV